MLGFLFFFLKWRRDDAEERNINSVCAASHATLGTRRGSCGNNIMLLCFPLRTSSKWILRWIHTGYIPSNHCQFLLVVDYFGRYFGILRLPAKSATQLLRDICFLLPSWTNGQQKRRTVGRNVMSVKLPWGCVVLEIRTQIERWRWGNGNMMNTTNDRKRGNASGKESTMSLEGRITTEERKIKDNAEPEVEEDNTGRNRCW